MQSTLWNDQPYIPLYYLPTLEAYRSDRVTGFSTQPEEVGDLLAAYGPFSFISMKPPTGATDSGGSTSGASGTVWLLIALAVAAVIVIAVVLSRRKAGDEDEA